MSTPNSTSYASNRNTSKSNPPIQVDEALVTSIVSQIVTNLGGGVSSPVPTPIAASAPPSLASFWGDLERLSAFNQELRQALEAAAAKTVGQALVASGAAMPSLEDFTAFLHTPPVQKGGTVVHAFWWGFHIQVSHQDLQAFLSGAGNVNQIVGTIGGGIPSPAQPWIALAAVFIAGALALLQSLDRGNGVYISMSWFAPGVFVPTSV